MIVMISGAAAILAGAVAFSLFRIREDDTVETFTSKMQALSPSGRLSLNIICSGPKPTSGPDLHLSKEDAYAAFWNSRLNVRIANWASKSQPADAELATWLHIMQEKHAKLRWQILLFAIESKVGKIRLGQTNYPRLLLWTYGEELDLLDKISQKCGPLEGHAIQAIL